jgi:hypothetical protein
MKGKEILKGERFIGCSKDHIVMGWWRWWTGSFELLTFGLFFGIVAYLISVKDFRKILEMMSGVLFGVVLEFVNVFVFGGYHYNEDFLVQIGAPPVNIPIVIGIGWGIILYAILEISDRFTMPGGYRILLAALLGLSIDLSMDVIAIRLDEGFWVWHNIVVDNQVSFEGVLGVAWGNYYGWFSVLFIINMLIRIERKKIADDNHILLIGVMLLNPVIATLLLVGSYYLQIPIIQWTGNFAVGTLNTILLALVILVIYMWRRRPAITRKRSWLSLLLFAYMHLYFLVGYFVAGIFREIPWFLLFFLVNFGLTVGILWRTWDFQSR